MENQPKIQNRVNITIDQLPAVICDECKQEVFTEGVMLREVSPLISGERDSKLAPIPVFICKACGAVLQKTLPEALRKPKIVTT
jgi:hypothetical protein